MVIEWKQPNPETPITSTELYPKRLVIKLRKNLNSPEVEMALTTHYEHLGDSLLKNRIASQKVILKAMLDRMTPWTIEGQKTENYYRLETTYYQPRLNNGRLNAEKSQSYQNISRFIRGTLARSIYTDIDIKNAHPVFLSQFLILHNLPSNPTLDRYIGHREQILDLVSKEQDLTRGQAKVLLLALMNGGDGISTLKKARVKFPILVGFSKTYKEDMIKTQKLLYKLTKKDPFILHRESNCFLVGSFQLRQFLFRQSIF